MKTSFTAEIFQKLIHLFKFVATNFSKNDMKIQMILIAKLFNVF